MTIIERDGELYDVIEIKLDREKFINEYEGNNETIDAFTQEKEELETQLDTLPATVKDIVILKTQELQEQIDALEFRNNEISQWL